MRVLAVALVLTAGSVWADTFNITASERGLVCTSPFGNNGADPTNNYFAGSEGLGTQCRDWFEFSIPTLTGGSLVSATLKLDEDGAIGGHEGGSLTFSVYGLGAQPIVLTNVTTSNPFGSVATSSASDGTTVSITLNAAALAATTADQTTSIFIGGIDSGETSFPAAGDFGFSGHANTVLSLTTAPSAVPEPSSLPLLGTVGFVAVVVSLRNRTVRT